MRKDQVVYVVYGPSAEWGDGVGVAGYATTYRQALRILRELEQEEAEYGPRSWRTVADCGAIEPWPAVDLGWDSREPLRRFVDRLNESL